MAIVLPEGHPRCDLALSAIEAAIEEEIAAQPRVRIGIINIMPRLEAYEPLLLAPLAALPELVEPVFVRLRSHGYQSSDHAHLDRFYRPFDEVLEDGPLDALILTGAPVEELAFEDVHYFRELEAILRYARNHVAVTLGLCWGGMVLGKLAGVEKRAFAHKLFGVFEDRVLVGKHDLLPAGSFPCAHSRHSGMIEEQLSAAARAGALRLLSYGAASGTTMFETSDRRFVAHLGHPEYEADRIAFEWERDRNLGRADVRPPVNFDVDAPATTWQAHRRALFAGLVQRALLGRVSVMPVLAREATAPVHHLPA